jgi:aminopeptidase YwaD
MKTWIQDQLEEIDIRRIDEHLRYFCGYEKLSGEPEALRSVEYITKYLESEGIACKTERFEAYLSNPVESFLDVDGSAYASRPRSFSAGCRDLRAELVYDRSTADHSVNALEREAFYRGIRGRIVLGYGYDERYAKVLEHYGAAAWIQIWTSDEVQIHEDTVSPVWGTPDMDSCFLQLKMPVIAIAGPSGRELIEKLNRAQEEQRPVMATITSTVETGVKQVALPVAEIKGKSDDFLLLSGHYDTWYIGAFDNGTANASALELARIFQKNQNRLERSVRIAWWPGHSNGRYMGSTWYCDHHWDELLEHCFAHLNQDLLGSRGTDETLAIRTAGLEGEAWLKEMVTLADPSAEIVTGRIGRGADQSLWGADIPYHINPRYEAKPERKTSAAPGPGRYWWHTEEDTYDKIDLPVLLKDTKVMCALALGLLTQPQLPVDVQGYFGLWDHYLKNLEENPEQQDGIREIRELLAKVQKLCAGNERAAVLAGGVLNRLFHSSGSQYEQDTAFAYGPLHLLGASGRLKQGESPAEWHLFYHTTFVRQKNRMVTELKRLLEQLENLSL